MMTGKMGHSDYHDLFWFLFFPGDHFFDTPEKTNLSWRWRHSPPMAEIGGTIFCALASLFYTFLFNLPPVLVGFWDIFVLFVRSLIMPRLEHVGPHVLHTLLIRCWLLILRDDALLREKGRRAEDGQRCSSSPSPCAKSGTAILGNMIVLLVSKPS